MLEIPLGPCPFHSNKNNPNSPYSADNKGAAASPTGIDTLTDTPLP